MALFVKVTDDYGEPFLVNLDQVIAIKKSEGVGGSYFIFTTDRYEAEVKEDFVSNPELLVNNIV